MDYSLSVFQRLAQVSRLSFESQSLSGSKMNWNCTGEGETLVSLKEGRLTFSDVFQIDTGRVCRDEKQWRLEDGGLAFYRFRNQVFERIFLFLPDEHGFRMQQPYACMPDDYFGELTVLPDEIVLTIKIIGSRKNEVICYRYR